MSRFRNRKHFVFFVTDRDVNFLSISVEIFKTFFVCYDSREFVPIFFFCDIFAFFFVRNDPIRRVWEGEGGEGQGGRGCVGLVYQPKKIGVIIAIYARSRCLVGGGRQGVRRAAGWRTRQKLVKL